MRRGDVVCGGRLLLLCLLERAVEMLCRRWARGRGCWGAVVSRVVCGRASWALVVPVRRGHRERVGGREDKWYRYRYR